MKPIYVSSEDHRTLTRVLSARLSGTLKVPPHLKKLQDELERAVILNALAMPPTVVSLHSRVKLRDLQSDEVEEWTLTLPEHADAEQQRLSAFAPIGTAILGYSAGDEIEWETPGGMIKIKIESVEPGAPISSEPPRSLYG